MAKIKMASVAMDCHPRDKQVNIDKAIGYIEDAAAQGVNLIYFIPTAVVALITHRKNGTLDLKTAKPLALLGLAGAAAGAFLAVSLESEILKKLFGGFLLLMGLSEIFKKKKGEDTHAKR